MWSRKGSEPAPEELFNRLGRYRNQRREPAHRLAVSQVRGWSWLERRADLGQPGVSGADDRLCPVSHLQLAEDVGDVVAHRLQAEEQRVGDLLIVPTSGDEGQDLA